MTRAATSEFHVPVGLIVVLGGLSAFAPLSIDMYLPALPAMTRELHADPAAGPLTVAAFFVGMCLGQLFHGPISDRVGRRGPLLAGIAVYVVASVAIVLVGSVEALIGLRLLQALGGCAGMVISRAVVRDRFSPQESAHVFSMLLLVMSLAPIVAPLIGGWVLLVAGWRTIFAILAAFGAVVGVAVFLRLPETRSAVTAAQAGGESPFRSYRVLLGEPRVIGYALAGGCSHAGLLTYLAVSPQVIISGFGVSAQRYGWVVAANGVGLILANYVNRRLLARLGYDRILRRANRVSLAASAVLLADALTGFGGLWGVAVPLFVIVGAIGFTQANAFAGAMAHDPNRAGAASALAGCLQFGLGAVGAAIAGAFHDGTARPMAAVIFTAYVAAFLFLKLLARAAP